MWSKITNLSSEDWACIGDIPEAEVRLKDSNSAMPE